MYKELQDLIRQVTNDSGLTGEARELLYKELESHMHEQIHDLELKGWNKTRILGYISQKFGSSKQLGRELALAHKSTFLYSLFHLLSVTLSTMFKHAQKILSLALLLVAISLNVSFTHYTAFKSLADCIGNFETVAALAPSNFEKVDSGKFEMVVDEATAGNMLAGIAPQEGCNNAEKVDTGTGVLSNPDIDEDGTLTVKEIYVDGSVAQLNVYMNTLVANLYPIVCLFLTFLDVLVAYAVLSAWMPARMKS